MDGVDMSRAVMQQALEALEKVKTDADKQPPVYPWDIWRMWVDRAITNLRAALAEPENQSQFQIDTKVNPPDPAQKPVAWMCPDDPDRATAFAWRRGYCIDCGKPRIPLFTTRTGDSNE